MTDYVVEPPQIPSVAIKNSSQRIPVHRIYCVGRNYAAHAREMGGDAEREPPFFFMKPADAVIGNDMEVPYPPRTENLHHEIELVAVIGKSAVNVPVDHALDCVFGYAVGNDLTRRDLQLQAREKGRPWDTGKSFDHAAPISEIHTVEDVNHISSGRIWLSVNDEVKQDADIGDLIWSVPEIIAELSTLYTLQPGDLIYTGTPAGVGPVRPGDTIEGGVEGLDVLRTRIISSK